MSKKPSKRFTRLTKVLARILNATSEQLLEGFQPAAEDEFDEVCAFRKDNLGSIITWDDKTYLRWRYNFGDDNQKANANNRLWRLKLNGSILGILGAQDVPLNVNGEYHKAVHSMDLLISKALDGSGLGAWISFALNERSDVMILVGANEQSKSIVRRMFHAMPNRQTWKLILGTEFLFKRYLKLGILAKLMACVVDPLLSAYYRLQYGLRDKSLSIKPIMEFGDDVNALILKTAGNCIYRRRDAAFLNWRFFDNPNCAYQAYGLYGDGKLASYLVYHIHMTEAGVQKQAIIDDLFFLCDNTSQGDLLILKTLIVNVATELRQQGVKLVLISSYGTFMGQQLKSLGFYLREQDLLFSLSCNVPELEAALYDNEAWFLTEADTHGAGI